MFMWPLGPYNVPKSCAATQSAPKRRDDLNSESSTSELCIKEVSSCKSLALLSLSLSVDIYLHIRLCLDAYVYIVCIYKYIRIYICIEKEICVYWFLRR